jgi:hypothetical protein
MGVITREGRVAFHHISWEFVGSASVNYRDGTDHVHELLEWQWVHLMLIQQRS